MVPEYIPRRQSVSVDRSWVIAATGLVLAFAVVGFAPLSGEAAVMVGITVFSVSLWVGTPVPPWFTSLIAIVLIGMAFSTELALNGFRAPATWLIVGGILIGEATRQSGLAALAETSMVNWLPDRFDGRPRAAYGVLLVVLCFAGLGLSVVVPSSLVRVLILTPILVNIGSFFQTERPRTGIVLGPLFATYYGSSGVLTGSIANIIVSGIVESTVGYAISWTEWLVYMFPLMGVGRVLSIIGVAYLLYRPNETAALRTVESERRSALSSERRMLLFLFVGVVIWATDFVHGLHPLYGALVVVLLSFAPRFGVIEFDRVSDVDFSILFFIGAIFAIAEGLDRTGFTNLAAQNLLTRFPQDASLPVILGGVVVLTISLTFLMEGLAVASVLTPILLPFAESAGVPILPVAMIEAAALNTYFFPYQSAVLVAILAQDVVEVRELIRMAAYSSLVTLSVIIPLQILFFALLW